MLYKQSVLDAIADCDTIGLDYGDSELSDEGLFARRKLQQIYKTVRELPEDDGLDEAAATDRSYVLNLRKTL